MKGRGEEAEGEEEGREDGAEQRSSGSRRTAFWEENGKGGKGKRGTMEGQNGDKWEKIEQILGAFLSCNIMYQSNHYSDTKWHRTKRRTDKRTNEPINFGGRGEIVGRKK